MARCFAAVSLFLCLATSAWAQAQPAPGAAATKSGTPAAKPPAKKPVPKAKIANKPPAPVETGPCQLGVISVVGDQFVVQKVGLTIFNNEYTEVPIDSWGLDDLVVARIRAAIAPGTSVRRIAYPKGTFAPYDHLVFALFRSLESDLTAIVRQVAANAGCERYFVVTKFSGQLEGTNQTLRGIGVLNRGIGIIGYTSLFANIGVTVFDGQTFAIRRKPFDLGSVLARSLARMTQDPLTKLDNADFPAPATEAANSATLRDHTRALLTSNLDKTLPEYLKDQ